MRTLFSLICVFLSGLSHGRPVAIESRGGSFRIEVPTGFTYYPKFMGLENVVMAPESPDLGTASLSLYFTGLADGVFDPQRLEQSQAEYQAGRRRYMEKRNLTLVEFIPYALKKNPQGLQVHTIGVIYSNGTKLTADRTFLIECPSSFVYAKSLGDIGTPAQQAALKVSGYSNPSLAVLEKIVLGLQCPPKK